MSTPEEMQNIYEMLEDGDHYFAFKTAVTDYFLQYRDVSTWSKKTLDSLMNAALTDLWLQNEFVKFPPHLGKTHFVNACGNAYFRWVHRHNNRCIKNGQTFEGLVEMPNDGDLLKKKHMWHNSVEDDTPKNLLKTVLTRNSPTKLTRCSNADDLSAPKLTRKKTLLPLGSDDEMPELELAPPLMPELADEALRYMVENSNGYSDMRLKFG